MAADLRLNGWLVVDKPRRLTSNRAVEQVRRATGAKAGHAGTLDPLATGVLPIALGEATKTVAYAMNGRKRYRFRIRWGVARDTDDSEGEIVGESDVRPDRDMIEAVLPRFTGTILQRPPSYSAIKIAGRRAYALARADRAPVLDLRPVEIVSLRLTATPDRDHADCEAVVGKGNYSRALARDLGTALGTSGHIGNCAGWRSARSPWRRRFRHRTRWRCSTYCRSLPASAADRDRAGRHPGAGLGGSRSRPSALRTARGIGRPRLRNAGTPARFRRRRQRVARPRARCARTRRKRGPAGAARDQLLRGSIDVDYGRAQTGADFRIRNEACRHRFARGAGGDLANESVSID